MRESRKPLVFSNFSGGIDQRDMEAAPNTVRDARNVWWRNGRLEGRPGFVGYPNPTPAAELLDHTNFHEVSYASAASIEALDALAPTPLVVDMAATTSTAFSTIFTGSHHALYFGCRSDIRNVLGVSCRTVVGADNITSIRLAAVEFWDGQKWLGVPHTSGVALGGSPLIWSSSASYLRTWGVSSVDYPEVLATTSFHAPSTWAERTGFSGVAAPTPVLWFRLRFTGTPDANHSLIHRHLTFVPFALAAEAQSPTYSTSIRSTLAVTGPQESMLACTKATTVYHLSGLLAFPAWSMRAWPGCNKSWSTTIGSDFTFSSQVALFSPSTLASGQSAAWRLNPRPTLPVVVYSSLSGRFWLKTATGWATNKFFPKMPTLMSQSQYAVLGVSHNPRYDAAAVSSDPDLVGTGAPYDSSVIAQLTKWPDTSILYYHDAQLFACGLKDSPQMVRWSAPDFDGALEVWPEVNFVLLTDNQDSSDITGAATLNEHLYVFKRNSIWMLVPNGATDEGLAIYSARKVVSGVGSVNHHSIAAGNGRLYFLSESGVCEFDGVNVKQLTQDKFQDSTLNITPENEALATGVWWATEGCYLLSVAVGNIDYNNLTVCYQPERDALWLWDGITPQIWAKVVTPERGEVLYYNDWLGRVCEFGRVKHDHHGAVDSWMQTHKLGLGDGRRYTVRDVRLTAANSAQSYEVTIQADDDDSESTSLAVNMEAMPNRQWALDAPNGARYWNTLVYDKVRVLDRRVDLRQSARQFSVKVRTSSVGQEFQLQSLALGVKAEGKR